jgi:hypothetical protein
VSCGQAGGLFRVSSDCEWSLINSDGCLEGCTAFLGIPEQIDDCVYGTERAGICCQIGTSTSTSTSTSETPTSTTPNCSSQECGYYKDVYSVGAQGEIVYKYLQDLFCNSTSCICPDAPDNPGESAPIHITFTCV